MNWSLVEELVERREDRRREDEKGRWRLLDKDNNKRKSSAGEKGQSKQGRTIRKRRITNKELERKRDQKKNKRVREKEFSKTRESLGGETPGTPFGEFQST